MSPIRRKTLVFGENLTMVVFPDVDRRRHGRAARRRRYRNPPGPQPSTTPSQPRLSVPPCSTGAVASASEAQAVELMPGSGLSTAPLRSAASTL